MEEAQGLKHTETTMTLIKCLRDLRDNILSNLYIHHKEATIQLSKSVSLIDLQLRTNTPIPNRICIRESYLQHLDSKTHRLQLSELEVIPMCSEVWNLQWLTTPSSIAHSQLSRPQSITTLCLTSPLTIHPCTHHSTSNPYLSRWGLLTWCQCNIRHLNSISSTMGKLVTQAEGVNKTLTLWVEKVKFRG